MPKKLHFFANWKMYLDVAESVQLAKEFVGLNYPAQSVTTIFPSSVALTKVVEAVENKKISVGAQTTYWADKGGYTGEVSAAMYKGLGCSYALVGHAERRHLFHESNHDVRLKLEAMLHLPLTPVLCVGETLTERKAGETEEVLEAQIRAAYMDVVWHKDITPIIAYEPVWAIGTGESCEPKEAEKVCGLISKWAQELLGREPVILYGGSVRAENIVQYVELPHVHGVLVGGASTKIETWSELIEKLV